MKYLLLIALCASLVTPAHASEPEPQFQAAVGYAVGGAVFCGGAYCIYKLYKFCQRRFPKTTTNSTASVFFQAAGDEYGASWNHAVAGSCVDYEEDHFHSASSEDRFIARLKVVVDDNGAVTSSLAAGQATPEQTQSWEEFQADVASHGLVVTGRGDGSKYYSRNRVPCGPDQVPIAFDERSQTIVHAGYSGRLRTITVERSKDFQSWSKLMTVTTGYGTGFEVDDLTRSGQMFYRVIAQ